MSSFSNLRVLFCVLEKFCIFPAKGHIEGPAYYTGRVIHDQRKD